MIEGIKPYFENHCLISLVKSSIQMLIDKIRLLLLYIAWSTAIINVIFGQSALVLANAGVFSLVFFFFLTLGRLKKESFTIIIILVFVSMTFLYNVLCHVDAI